MSRKAELNKSLDGEFWYTLVGDNGEPLNHSETQKRRRTLIEVLEKYFPDFPIVDLTKKKNRPDGRVRKARKKSGA